MTAILRLDATGRVLAASPAAEALLGPTQGRRCCDVVHATSGKMPRCEPGCATSLGAGRSMAAIVRGRNCAVTCTVVGDQIVVLLRPGDVVGPGAEVLTRRECEVLLAVAHGRSTKQIASELDLGACTVRTHLERARAKLGARTRAEAVARAVERGDITP